MMKLMPGAAKLRCAGLFIITELDARRTVNAQLNEATNTIDLCKIEYSN